MEPATAAILLATAAASSAAQLYANQQNIKYADEVNEESIALANTAHQREVRDLEAAGLNPILSGSSSGASTPVLKAPNVESIDGGIANTGKSLANSINGIVDAQIQQAQADAVSAQAYARQAGQLASIEREQAQVDLDLVKLDADARMDAIEGTATPEHYRGRDGVYDDLVKQYRNEIKSGKWKASLGRAVLRDVLDGGSSAAQIYRNVKGRTPGKVRP